MTAREAATLLGVNERTVRRAILRGELPADKHSGIFGIAPADLNAWLRRRASPHSESTGCAVAHQAPSELPRPFTTMVGRERELATAASLLRRDDVRLLTLTGVGGIGKTRLSLEVAAHLQADFVDGVWVVPLAEVLEAGLVATAIGVHLGLLDAGIDDGWEALIAALRGMHVLLVLDNFEHVLAAAPLVSALLESCLHLKVLVTSRALLRIGGEHALPVPPLALLDAAGGPSASSAVRLFTDRARAILPSFAVTPANVATVAAVCQRLAGIPLAIELAASQITVLPPDALLARIEAHLPLPVGGPRDAPDRQRTMTDAIGWSYTLLSPAEQQLFRRIGAFVGGFSLDAAFGISDRTNDDTPGPDPLTALAALVDASLVQRPGENDDRFTVLEPIRAFSLEQLSAAGEFDATLDALADWYLALVERRPLAANVTGAERYLSILGAEHANLRQALEWVYQRRDADRLLRLAVALGGYWYERNEYRDGCMWMERALTMGVEADAPLRGRALVQLGFFLGLLGDVDRSRALIAEGVTLMRRDNDADVLALALIWQGAIEMQNSGYDQAERVLGEALDLAEVIPEASIAAAISARAMSNLGVISHARGDLDGALRWHEMALRACREHGYLLGALRALCDLGDVNRDRQEYDTAMAYYRESLSVLGERSDLRAVIGALVGGALAAISRNQGERAGRLLGAAAELSETFHVPTFMVFDRSACERAMQTTRAMVGPHRFDEVFATGRHLTRADAIAEVMASGIAPVSQEPRHLLSHREREVLRLLAAGLRDREIAEGLFISVRTVEGHVARILAKLNVPTRVAAARAAIDLGLIGDSDSE